MKKTAKKDERQYWVCIIGGADKSSLSPDADSPIRQVTKKAFKELTGHDAENCWSGWGADKKTVDKLLKAWNLLGINIVLTHILL